ncbi:2-dehydro-3-deoxygalactonokinase [Salinicoccus roseus]|nr:2-dehydro-3-deoxygalactonokinase [Salinicoccus roseus]
MYVMLIDSGTTNTRIRIVNEESKKIAGSLKLEVGVKNSAMDKNNTTLKQAIQHGVKEVLSENTLSNSDINYIIASGMITSNLGLKEVSHIVAPAKISDFASGIEKDEINGIDCYFIPGMKNKRLNESAIIEEVKDMDIMRGEEVEVFGLLEQIEVEGKGLIILPGSHTKFVMVNEKKELLSCFSTLGGELMQAVQSNTILSSSLKGGLIKEIEVDFLKKGYYKTKEEGLTRSLFGVRLLDLYTNTSENQRANYMLGSIFHEDIQALKFYLNNENVDWMIIGGSEILKESMSHLLEMEFKNKTILKGTKKEVEKSYIIGSILIQNHLNNRSDNYV